RELHLSRRGGDAATRLDRPVRAQAARPAGRGARPGPLPPARGDRQRGALPRQRRVVGDHGCGDRGRRGTDGRTRGHRPAALRRLRPGQAPGADIPGWFPSLGVSVRNVQDMARITVEDCLEQVPNRFELVLLAARRAKQLLKGARPLVESDNKEIVTALREVADTKVRLQYGE